MVMSFLFFGDFVSHSSFCVRRSVFGILLLPLKISFSFVHVHVVSYPWSYSCSVPHAAKLGICSEREYYKIIIIKVIFVNYNRKSRNRKSQFTRKIGEIYNIVDKSGKW